MMNENKLVLVTGASGYVGSHIVKTLLEQGYRVRGTVRSIQNGKKIQPLKELCPEAAKNLELVQADLTSEEHWPSMVRGCDYVLHVASPVVISVKNEDDLIKPAVEGTINVLKAVASANNTIKRVVITSSIASVINDSSPNQDKVYTEENWSDLNCSEMTPYIKSKILAEQAAWDFVTSLKDKKKLELTTICPGFIFGPVLTDMEGEIVKLMKRMMTGKVPLTPRMAMPTVDVRDVAKAHVAAMTAPKMANQRLILVEDTYWFKELAQALSSEFSPKGYSIGTREAPYVLLWLVSWLDSDLSYILPSLGRSFKVDNSKMKRGLDMEPIPMEKSVVDMAYSLIQRGIVPRKF